MSRRAANVGIQRVEAYPSLAARKHWRRYAIGMTTEALFTLGLTFVGLLLAVLATAIWQ